MAEVQDDRAAGAGGAVAVLALALRLLLRWGPALAGIWLVGDIAQSGLRWLAVLAGQHNRMAGVAVLTLAILVRIVTVVAMFRLLCPPGPGTPQSPPAPGAGPQAPAPGRPVRRRPFQQDVAMVLVPFFLYYAAWGLLGDAMRQYALLSMALDPLGRFGPVLDIRPGQAALVWAGGAWLLRRGAKAMQARQPGAALWPFLVVAAEAMWIFVGLYLIDAWKDGVMAFLAGLPSPSQWPALIGAAAAATVPPLGIPSDRQPVPLSAQVLAALRYAALPLVWFNLGAIIRGRDVKALDERLGRRVAPVARRWQALPPVLRDFAGHFIAGIIRRWQAVANAVQVMLGAGLALLLTVIVGFRLVDWLSGWGIRATMQAIGPLPYAPARLAELALDLVWGTPRSPGNGLLPEVVKVCLISAALDLVRVEDRAGLTAQPSSPAAS